MPKVVKWVLYVIGGWFGISMLIGLFEVVGWYFGG